MCLFNFKLNFAPKRDMGFLSAFLRVKRAINMIRNNSQVVLCA